MTSASNTLTIIDNTPIDITSNLGWTPVQVGDQYDYYDDTQARADGVDLVGNASNPLLYTQYNVATKEVAFRLRMESYTAKGSFYLLGIAGNPSGSTLDFFIGVFVPTNGTPEVRFYENGTGLNTSPSTTSFDTRTSQLATGQVVDIRTTGTDLDVNGKNDGFISFKFSADALVAFANSSKGGLTGYTIGSQVGMVLMTATQTNSINGDIGGIRGITDTPWQFTPTVMNNAIPTGANASVTINENTEHVLAIDAVSPYDADKINPATKQREKGTTVKLLTPISSASRMSRQLTVLWCCNGWGMWQRKTSGSANNRVSDRSGCLSPATAMRRGSTSRSRAASAAKSSGRVFSSGRARLQVSTTVRPVTSASRRTSDSPSGKR